MEVSSLLRIDIRPAVVQDIHQILLMENESFSAPWTREMFEAELTGNPFSRLYIGCVGDESHELDRVVGYICYWIVFEELRLLNLAVSSPVRRQGISRRMVQWALRDGCAQGATRALLEVRASNLAAQSLYAGFGFQAYGKRAAYYTNPDEDAILMQLDDLERAISSWEELT